MLYFLEEKVLAENQHIMNIRTKRSMSQKRDTHSQFTPFGELNMQIGAVQACK